MKKSVFIASALALSLFAAAPAFAEMMSFSAKLDGASQKPPVDTKAMGTAEVKVDTDKKTISWAIKYDGLTGDPTAAHFHAPAAPGENAPPAIDISKMIDSGSAPITDAQLADLEAGKVYINIHTAKYPDGEIRGQVVK